METTAQRDINTLTIYELRRAVRRAVRRAGLGEDDIRKFGDLRRKGTWRLAYREYCTPKLSDSDRNLLFGEVEFKSDDTGQLLLEYETDFEPPDPDDFSSLDDFYCEFRRWEKDYPDHAAASRRWAQLEVAAYEQTEQLLLFEYDDYFKPPEPDDFSTTIDVLRLAVYRAGLGNDDIKKFGDLRRKQTWRLAYREFCIPIYARSVENRTLNITTPYARSVENRDPIITAGSRSPPMRRVS